MAKIETMVLTKDDLECNSDAVKDLVLNALWGDGLLTGEQAAKWSKTHAVLIKKASLVSQWYKKLVGEPEEFRFMIATMPEVKFGETQEGEPDG